MKITPPTLFDVPTPPLSLRPYQEEAVKKILWAQKFEGNDLCVLPTGAGKSVVIAHLAKELNHPLLILQPSKEILEQNYDKLKRYVKESEIGVYSASVGRKDIKTYTLATIQSIYKIPQDFSHFGMVLLDECHLLNQKNTGGMFTSFLKAIGSPKVVGFTATPYRLGVMYRKSGGQFAESITTTKLINRTAPLFWNRIVYNINNKDLLENKYLCPLEYLDHTVLKHEDIPTNKTKSDFDMEAYSKLLPTSKIVESIAYAQTIARHVLVFCSSIEQANDLSHVVWSSRVVTGTTPKKEREKIINDFKNGRVQVVLNVGVLTTGFDHPSLDCIVCLRPTKSIALYYQMLGRGVRTAHGKESCKVIDLSNNVEKIGRVETIALTRVGNKWELMSERGAWHNRELYRYKVDTSKRRNLESDEEISMYESESS